MPKTIIEKSKFAVNEVKKLLKSRKELKKELKGKTPEEKKDILQKLQQRKIKRDK